MKMSDVFELPVRVEPGGVMPFVNESGGAILFVADTHTAEAAAHATNCHDELVAALGEAIDILCSMEDDPEISNKRSHYSLMDLGRLDEVLAKANSVAS